MPNKCCVPGCTGNYKTGKKIQVFSFPKDCDTLKKWLRAIPRKDFVPTSCTKVCADHFDASCIERTTSYTDPRTGKVIEVGLPVPRLRPGSVPTVFPGCPSYLSVPHNSTRETPDAKRSRQEASQLARAVEESLASYEVEQERDRFSSLEELKARLQVVSVSAKWTVIHKEECSMFLNITDYREPWLNASLTVFKNLKVFACYQGSQIKNLGSTVVPDSVQKPFAYSPRFYRLYETIFNRLYETVVAFGLPIVVRSVTMRRPMKLKTLHAFGAKKRSMKLVRMAKLADNDRTDGSCGTASSSTQERGCIDAPSNGTPAPLA
ncbi:hypothetical protein HPB49_023507 [Dermacentor silvarum]|uniref:Uncharacterized protein n=1 Tax=Dermacentor silvarum TaxID=543639 RepID=A0ACB8DRU8_DERSI|nr:hypothetical protein HPB49_023507 [Dermacentor silvarum]